MFQLLRPIWRRFVTVGALLGAFDSRGFERDPESYMAATWIPPRAPMSDPVKDVEADVLAIGAGLISRRQAVAARGYDLEALDREIAADRRAAAAQGLEFPAVARPAAEPVPALEDAR